MTSAAPSAVPKTPLESWIRGKIGLGPESALSRRALEAYQLERLRSILFHVRGKSPFYRRLLADLPAHPLPGLSHMAALPLTAPEDIRSAPLQFLCLSQDDVARVVTLQTSGTTQAAKRIFFTEADLELTIDFYHHGMSTMVSAGDRVLILMPGKTPFSVGDLLVRALSRMGVEAVVHGPVHDTSAALRAVLTQEIDCLVGIPIQIFHMARDPLAETIPPGRLKSILLSADHVSKALIETLTRRFHCPVYQHYGMTETGLAGGVECEALAGYHPREADLYFEIIDPDTGRPVKEGETGELVVTTLTQRAMPLIRYRTGDLARFIPEPCPCGTILKRLDRVQARRKGIFPVTPAFSLSIPQLDAAVLAVPAVIDYEVQLDKGLGKLRLILTAYAIEGAPETLRGQILDALRGIPGLRDALESGHLALAVNLASGKPPVSTGPQKRRIVDRRNQAPCSPEPNHSTTQRTL
jgi:phenylacetate-coenzyme A ligase PaaK-like adenylate-forming protein